MNIPEYALDLLLSYDGREQYLETGHFLKFEVIRRITVEVNIFG